MRVRIVRDGKEQFAEVDLAAGTIEIAGGTQPFTVVSTSPMRVELEIAGEKVVVDQWPEGMATPPGPVDVLGERWSLSALETTERTSAVSVTRTTPSATAPPSPATTGSGIPVLPPMPGKAIEVRVKDGEQVAKGQILLILEAMKMRNEILSPISGRVERLQVRPGSTVLAHEPMLFVVPE